MLFLAITELMSINTRMITRRLEKTLKQYLRQFPAVALLGPRQVGKTTLARHLAGTGVAGTDETGTDEAGTGAPHYLDLENPADMAKLTDARGYLAMLRGKLVIIDEVQRAPEIFQVLRGLIDEYIMAGEDAGHFLLLGSASIELLRQSGETLAGRIAYMELEPLDILEVGQGDDLKEGDGLKARQESELEVGAQNAKRLWVRGGFPRSFLANNDQQSTLWRANFITTYLERDIPQLGVRIPAETLRRFWTMLAHSQGGLLNIAQFARSLAVDGKTAARYLDLMVDLLLVRRLPPYHANIRKRLVKSPKTYIRDSGLLHTLLRLDDLDQLLGHPIAGDSWEGFVIENLLRTAPNRTEASFYRTMAGAEIDLVLNLPGGAIWAIEIKSGAAPKVSKGFHNARKDINPDKAFVVYGGDERYPMGANIEAIGLRELAGELEKLS